MSIGKTYGLIFLTVMLWIIIAAAMEGQFGIVAGINLGWRSTVTLLWPLAVWIPGIAYALPGLFAPWSDKAKLRRRIRKAKHEQHLLQLRQNAEEEESRTREAFQAYINGP